MDKKTIGQLSLFDSMIDSWDDFGMGEFVSLNQLFHDRLHQLGINRSEAESIMDIDYKALEAIINPSNIAVNTLNLIKFAAFLNVRPDKIFKLFVDNLPVGSFTRIEYSQLANFIATYFDIAALKKMGFFTATKDFRVYEQKICNFFELSNIKEYAEIRPSPAFSKTKKSVANKMRDLWVKSAYVSFKKIDNKFEYSREKLKELLPKFRPQTQDERNGLRKVFQALYQIGITVLFIPSLPKVQVRGATFSVNGKPCVAISDFNDRYPNLWFALIHEMYHVLFDFEEIESFGCHLSSDLEQMMLDEMLLDENSANEFSRDYLFPKSFSEYTNHFLSDRSAILDYTSKSNIHTSFPYCFYLFDSCLPDYTGPKYRGVDKYIPSCDVATQNLNPSFWDFSKIGEAVLETKVQMQIT